MEYTNSPLVAYTGLSPNHSGLRTRAIDRITPHCVVGQLTAEGICGCFASPSSKASCNYAIGRDGKVGLCVAEANRSWCSSSGENDQRAVTIECASDMAHPYAMNPAVYGALARLCEDVCRRNGKGRLLWLGSKEKALGYSPKPDEMVLTVHRWFARKSCPGDWLYSRLGGLAAEVTAALGGLGAPYVARVAIDDLNIRTGPGTDFPKTGSHTGKGYFTIVEERAGKGSVRGWGRLASGAGWVSLDYCERI